MSTHGQDTQPPGSTSTDCTTLRDLNTSSHVTHVAAAWGSGPGCRRRVWCSARHLTQRRCGGCMRALAAARRRSRGGASTERGVETEQRPGEAGAGAEAAAPHPAHGLLPSREHRAPPAWDAHLAAGLLALSPHGHGQASQLRGRQALPRQSRRGWEGREGPVRCRHGAAVSPPAARPLTRHAWHRRPPRAATDAALSGKTLKPPAARVAQSFLDALCAFASSAARRVSTSGRREPLPPPAEPPGRPGQRRGQQHVLSRRTCVHSPRGRQAQTHAPRPPVTAGLLAALG